MIGKCKPARYAYIISLIMVTRSSILNEWHSITQDIGHQLFTEYLLLIDKNTEYSMNSISSIWEDVNKGDSVGSGKFNASCKYCTSKWTRGEVAKLEEHLANHCSKAPATIVRKYLSIVLEHKDKAPIKKRKVENSQQTIITNYHDSIELPNSRITRDSVGSGKFNASCKYCTSKWTRGEVAKLEEHLANHCSKAPATIVRKYLSLVLECKDKAPIKKKKVENSQQTIITNYHDSIELPNSRITSINRALAKFFITCGISFRIVEHPFFINFAKELNAGYEPPSREILSGQLLECELSQVNSKVKSEIEKETNLTLG
ncbi:2127_t:CDS:2 [Entrophospora sp. SA101]|nr:2127_t:CDS:2 [Entrophospora sp. SA101]